MDKSKSAPPDGGKPNRDINNTSADKIEINTN